MSWPNNLTRDEYQKYLIQQQFGISQQQQLINQYASIDKNDYNTFRSLLKPLRIKKRRMRRRSANGIVRL